VCASRCLRRAVFSVEIASLIQGVTMTEVRTRLDWLNQRKAELEQRIAAIKRDYAEGLSADSSEQAIELENAEVLAEIQRLAVNELADINQELRRLQQAQEEE